MHGSAPAFRDREDAGERLEAALAERARVRPFTRPLVLGIPRGGLVIAGVVARALGAEIDVVLSRKLRAPEQPELALGAIAEDGAVYLHTDPGPALRPYLDLEIRQQAEEIARRAALLRRVRPAADPAGRSVIVTDDGLATGATMVAALRTIRARSPRELIMAVPVAPTDRLEELRPLCDEAVCVLTVRDFWAIGQFYECFEPVEDERVLEILRDAGRSPGAG